jgi:hypothetical protein
MQAGESSVRNRSLTNVASVQPPSQKIVTESAMNEFTLARSLTNAASVRPPSQEMLTESSTKEFILARNPIPVKFVTKVSVRQMIWKVIIVLTPKKSRTFAEFVTHRLAIEGV